MGRYIRVDSQKEFELLEEMRRARRKEWIEDILAFACWVGISFLILLFGMALA